MKSNNKQKGVRRGALNCQASREGSVVPSLGPLLKTRKPYYHDCNHKL